MVKASKKTGRSKSLAKKAPALSQGGTKKRLARFGKKRTKGQAGEKTKYVSRAVILRRLQLTLKDFRRLCILKGIYPRDTGDQQTTKTYYHIKDIAAVAREPLLAKFREFKTFMRRVRHLVGRGDVKNARKKHEKLPTYVLHHLVKERYPKFRDALNDLDDALSTISLFAALPAEGRIAAEKVAKCEELARRWHHYIAGTGCLRKAFVSIKGVYFSASVKGVDVTWIVPHAFSHDLPSKRHVDYRVMLTFLEFYDCLLQFVLFKLFRDDAPKFTTTSTTTTSEEAAETEEDEDKRVFTGLRFELSREARYQWLEFVIKAGGGQLVDTDPTHRITDRSTTVAPQEDNVERVQPQWVVDSLNNGRLLPVARYAPGAVLPPHLSPFVTDDDYQPAYKEELNTAASAFAEFHQEQQRAVVEDKEEEEEEAQIPEEVAPTTKTKKRRTTDEAEEPTKKELATMMMSKKAKRLHGRMLYGMQRKKDAVDRLKARRAKLEESRKKE